jgi:Fe-S cluster assembly protein SufD
MSSQVKQETIYTGAFREMQETSGESAWLKILRENAIDSFGQLGFPTSDKEDWKYTNVQPFVKNEFEIARDVEIISSEKIAAFAVAEAQTSVLAFVNGKISQEFTNLSGIENGSVLSLSEALSDERFSETVKTHLARGVDYEASGFTALNTALWQDGAFVFIPKNTKIETPIHLLFVANGERNAGFPRVLVALEQGAEATLIESYVRADETEYLTDSIVEIVLADNARLTHYRVQRESHKALHVGATSINLQRASFYDSTNLNFGAALARHDIKLNFNQEAGEAFVDGLYMVGETQHTDTHSAIEHLVPRCTSHQTYKGVLNGKSRAVFNGKVYVHEGASGTDGYQSNKNLLLSNDARVDTKPQLEIFNDDVKCAHGATVGQLEDEELFYLLSRGLNESLARNLLTYGFAEEVINKIKIESIKKQLDEAVLNRLDAKI